MRRSPKTNSRSKLRALAELLNEELAAASKPEDRRAKYLAAKNTLKEARDRKSDILSEMKQYEIKIKRLKSKMKSKRR